MVLTAVVILVVLIAALGSIYLLSSSINSSSTTTTSTSNSATVASITTTSPSQTSSLLANSSATGTTATTTTSSTMTLNSTTSTSSSMLSTTSHTSSSSSSSQSTVVNIPNLITKLNLSLTGGNGFAYDSANSVIFAAATNHSIVEINATSNQVMGSIQLSQAPDGIVFDNVSNTLWMSTTDTSNAQPEFGLAEISPFSQDGSGNHLYSVLYNQTVFSGFGGDLAFNSRANTIYIANEYVVSGKVVSNIYENVTVFDASKNSIVANVTVGYSSPGLDLGPIMYDSYYGLLYGVYRTVGQDGGGNAVYFALNVTSYKVTSLGLPSNFPSSLAYNPTNGQMYVSPAWDCAIMGVSHCPPYPEGNISVVYGYNTSKPIRVSSNLNETLDSIVYDSQNNQIYVANGTFSLGGKYPPNAAAFNVTEIDSGTGKITGVMAFPNVVIGLLVNPANEQSELYVVTTSEVYVISIS